MPYAFQDDIVFAKLLNSFEAGAVYMAEIVLNQEEGGIFFRDRQSNVEKAFDAAVKLALVREEQYKVIDFVKGEGEAILHFLLKANSKYNLRGLGQAQAPPG